MKKINLFKIITFSVLALSLVCFLIFHFLISNNSDNQATDNNIKQLKTLSYLRWSNNQSNSKRRGVIKYIENKTFDGPNIYTDDEKHAYLINMRGEVIHIWTFPNIKGKWEYCELLNDGKIIALCVGKCIAKIDRNSDVIWIKYLKANHDIELLSDGSFLVPSFDTKTLYKGRIVRFDSIIHISKDGKIIKKWSTYKHLRELKKLHKPSPLDKNKKKNTNLDDYYDYYHLNTIEILPENDLAQYDSRFKPGNWLICLRNVNLIIILNEHSKKPIWSWGPNDLDWPHMPTMLKNGNILIFDNGTHRDFSRIVELNPKTKEIVWEYVMKPKEEFFSNYRGSNQRLPNGNTLICESEKGHVFEINKNKDIVWEFYNTEIKNGKRKLIYRFMRITNKKKLAFLD